MNVILKSLIVTNGMANSNAMYEGYLYLFSLLINRLGLHYII